MPGALKRTGRYRGSDGSFWRKTAPPESDRTRQHAKNFYFHTVDEDISERAVKLDSLIKSIDKNIRIFANPCSERQLDLQKITPYIDIWAPHLYNVCRTKNTGAMNIMKAKGEFFWNYANPVGVGGPKNCSPYKWYRLIPWLTWKNGMKGTGFWVYLRYPNIAWQENNIENIPYFIKNGKPYRRGDKYCWDVVYLSKYAPSDVCKKELIIPSKRWEAWREGMEDYIYLDILSKTIKEAEKKKVHSDTLNEAKRILDKWPDKVIGDLSINWADAAKEETLRTIAKLREDIKNIKAN
ncbi:MAG: hypothetical protein PHH77_05665 [Victivallaceae bacterium]|nr:hypothetical protein [Victivallaceae bacterium]